MLLGAACILAILTVVIVRYLTGRTLTLATLFWAGWLLGIPAYLLAVNVGVLPPLDEYGIGNIMTTFYGATAGFLAASLLAVPFIRKREAAPRMTYNGFIWVIVAAQFLLGCYLLVQRIAAAGLNLDAIRSSYLEDAYFVDALPPEYRLYNYLALIALVPVILVAARNRQNGQIGWNSLAVLFLATVPGGLSTGGRIWLIQTLAAYFVSYSLASGPKLKVGQSLRRVAQVLVVILAAAGLFTAFGAARDTDTGWFQVSGSSIPDWAMPLAKSFAPLYQYLGVPTAASGPAAAFVSNGYGGNLLGGQNTFPFATSQLVRFGWFDQSALNSFTLEQRVWISANYDARVGFTHATLAPMLVADFGDQHLLNATFVVFFVLQFLFLVTRAAGGVWHVAATILALYGGLLIFQDASFGTASSAIPIIAALVLRVPFRKRVLIGTQPVVVPR